MRRPRVRLSLLAVGLALGWSVVTATPAAAMEEKVTATITSECGVAVITVKNLTGDAVTYVISVLGGALNAFTNGGGIEERVHKIRAGEGDVFSFVEGGVEIELEYVAPAGCKAAKLVPVIQPGCTNFLVTVQNEGDAVAPDVQVIVDGKEIAAGPIEPEGAHTRLVNPLAGNDLIEIVVQQAPVDPSELPFDLIRTERSLENCEGRTAEVTDTCDGVHIKVGLPEKPGTDTLIIEAASGKRQELEVTGPVDEVDVAVPSGTLLAIGFPFIDALQPPIGVSFVVARFHEHVAKCPPSPSAPAGGGGGLPVTGAPTAAAAGIGAGLLVLGFAAVLFVRRRRSTFTA